MTVDVASSEVTRSIIRTSAFGIASALIEDELGREG